jgi:hypothetical protein
MTDAKRKVDRIGSSLLSLVIGISILSLLAQYGCEAPTSPNLSGNPPEDTSTIRILSPNGGELYKMGDTISLRWRANTDSVTSAVLEISFDGGKIWITMNGTRTIHPYEDDWGNLRYGIPDSLYDWANGITVPVIPGSECLVRVRDYNRDYLADESDNFFTLSAK